MSTFVSREVDRESASQFVQEMKQLGFVLSARRDAGKRVLLTFKIDKLFGLNADKCVQANAECA